MTCFPIEIFSEYSIQEAFCHIDELVKRAGELNLPAICLTDIHSLSGVPELLQQLEKYNKGATQKIKPLIGVSMRFKDNDIYKTVMLFARNQKGYYDLCKILGRSQLDADNKLCYVTIPDINEYRNDVVCVYKESSQKDTWQHEHKFLYGQFQEIGGSAPDIYGRPVYYVNHEDRLYQQIIVCSKLKKTLKEVKEDPSLLGTHAPFFDNQQDFALYNEGFDESCKKLIPLVEDFSIVRKAIIPQFDPQANADEILHKACQQGWKDKDLNSLPDKLKQRYVEQIKEELSVFKTAKLSNYFLIVKDFADYAKQSGCSFGLRGSASAALSAYLLGISDIDPLRPDPELEYMPERELLFERFYSYFRNSPSEISFTEFPLKSFER